jgi:small subunit ribosomal protein S3
MQGDKVGDLIVEDYKSVVSEGAPVSAGVPRIEIERDNAKVKVYIHCSRPGVVIGKGGAEIERLRLELEKRLGKPASLSMSRLKNPDTKRPSSWP